MRPVLIAAALLFAAPQSADQPYELKGEAPGITLKQFRTNHKYSDCSSRSVRQTSCRVYEGVSFAGVVADTFKGCATIECDSQGILANFFDGRLVSLSYGVSVGSVEEIIKTLKKKYGEPSEATDKSAKWKNSIGYLSVSDMAVPGQNGSVKSVATVVTSALNDSGQSKDI
jgi:hypothetical protein